jgi:hypothetical protein
MSMKLKTACLMICVLAAAGAAMAQSTGANPAAERTESINSTVPLPRVVLDLLIEPFKDDEHYRDSVIGKSDEELNKYFAAVVVHLSRPDQVDYVIEGRGPFAGADSARLWIVRSSGSQFKVVLNETASFFELLNIRTSGYKDIRSVWIVSGQRRTRLFHFTGTEYKRAEEKWSGDLQ